MAPRVGDVTRRGAAVGAAAGAIALSVRALARPIDVGDRRMLDWDAVRSTAHRRSGEAGPLGVPEAGAVGAAYDAMAEELAPRIAEVVQAPMGHHPPFDVLDRRGFVDANLVIVQRLFEPIERLRAQLPDSRLAALGRMATSRYVGELFGFLSTRVLGQYDPVLLLAPADGDRPRTALSLVEPNVRSFERRQGLPPESLRRWLVLHELTHAWQFEQHPWLREYMASLMRELMAGELLDGIAGTLGSGGRAAPASGTLVRSMVPAVRGQLRAVGRIQAVMSVAEGHGNFVMHRVGRAHIPDFDNLEHGFHERKAQRTLLEQIVLIVTGMRMKMRQYEIGEAFADHVTHRGGLELLNRVWEGPAMMPTLAELKHPDRWVARAV